MKSYERDIESFMWFYDSWYNKLLYASMNFILILMTIELYCKSIDEKV